MAGTATQSRPGCAQSWTAYKLDRSGAVGHCDVVVEAPWGGGAALSRPRGAAAQQQPQ